jgi:hypothetical protein
MSRPLDTRLGRVEGRRTAAEPGPAAIPPGLRAAVAIGVVIRSALARAGIDAASAPSLSYADAAAARLAAILETAGLPCQDATGDPPANADDRAAADAFEAKILAMAQHFAGGQMPDFANASFAELFAWSLAQPAAE